MSAHHTDVASREGVAVMWWQTKKMSRLFFAGCIGETYSMVRYLMREEKEGFRKGL